MRGNAIVITALNKLLAEELTAINQYVVHAEMCANWHLDRLHKALEGNARAEMKHAEKLIARILFLEGTPTVSKLLPMQIGKDVPSMLESDLAAELGAVASYNGAVALAREHGDETTAELLGGNLEDEEGHVDWIEAQRTQIAQMGLGVYLAAQVAG